LGFERCQKFEQIFERLQYLEKWLEVAIRPSCREICDPEDLDLFDKELDDVPLLQKRCDDVRKLMNKTLPPIETIKKWDEFLQPGLSTIGEAGQGLFYRGTTNIPEGTTICFYSGHLHTFRSARDLGDKSYLMMVGGQTFVDPRLVLSIKARYINDPLNEKIVNCKYVPMESRSAVVTTKTIHPGEELFASYGEMYWSQHLASAKIYYTNTT
jgi:hypothetical protein